MDIDRKRPPLPLNSDSPRPQIKRPHLDPRIDNASYHHRKRPHLRSNHNHQAKRRHYYSEYECLSGNLHLLTLNNNPSKAIYELSYHRDEFKHLISSSHHDGKTLVEIVKVLSLIVKADRQHNSHREVTKILDFLLSDVALETFFFSLAQFIRCIPMTGDEDERLEFPTVLQGVISLFDVLLDQDRALAAKHLPVDACVGTTQQLSLQAYCYQDINKRALQLQKKRNEICTMIYESRVKCHSSGMLSIALPSPEELHHEPERRENIVDKQFPSIEDYLKIQRDLLREDFINPLRSALRESGDKPTLKFTNVRFDKGQTITLSGVAAYTISFQTSRKNIKWNRSKALMYGSLVCLSEDNFRTVLYATVVEREVAELEAGILTVQLQDYDERLLSPSTEYTMIESPGYFEAYAPVIKKLNEIKPEDLAQFSQYIVQLRATVAIPTYLRNTSAVFNLKGIICDCRSEECSHSQVDVLDNDSWQRLSTPRLDASQKKALHLALTHELALIQGPPGTGKTYIGLKLMQTLLQNGHLWKYKARGTCPIVVVCYTNHALDQFLEEVIDLNIPKTEIIRVGGRSKSEKVNKFNLRLKVYEACRGDRRFFNNPRKRLLMTGKKVGALDEILKGKFSSSHCQLYCYFLSKDVLFNLKSLCDISFPYLDEFLWGTPFSFASWLDEDIKHKIDTFSHSPDEELIDEDRQDDDHGFETKQLCTILGEEGLKAFVQKLGGLVPFTERQAHNFQDDCLYMYEPRVYIKLMFFKYCLKKLLEELQKQQEMTADEQRLYDMEIERIKVECLQEANVIGMTTTAAARDSELLSKVESKILIVEEAAEVLEPQLIATLTKHTQHLILIGDHKQLRPKTNDYNVGHNYKLEISMFERLVRNNLPHATLTVQHRMRPEISQIVSDHIYEKKLQDHESTKKYESVQGIKHNLYFISHEEQEALPDLDLKSHSNVHEAKFLASLCKYLLQQEYGANQITVITPYMGQLFELRSQFREKNISDVRIITIDNYQGEENDIILLSLVRSNKQKIAGFVQDENRICVALSRAKCGLYCIGNFDLFKTRSKLWLSIVEDVKSKGYLGDKLQLFCARHEVEIEVSNATDFDKVPDGGCSRPCEERYNKCNHVCPRKCHPDDRDHNSPCTWPCSKKCVADLHWCKRLCSEECGRCMERVLKTIPACEHKQPVPCHMKPESFSCKEPCPKTLTCGHKCTKKCGQECDKKCMTKVERELICGHKATVECHLNDAEAARRCKFPCKEELACGHSCFGDCGKCRQGRLHVTCRKRCTRKLLCGHTCSARCDEICPPCKQKCAYSCQHGWCGNKCSDRCKPCNHRCDWRCRHNKCTEVCGRTCDRERCNKPCNKRLKDCRHPCLGLCGEPCPPVCHKCDTVKERVQKIYSDEKCHEESAKHRYIELDDCGHVFSVEALDRWMKRGMHQVVEWKRCPVQSCKVPVMTTLRYANTTKRILRDMNELKTRQTFFLSSRLRQQMLSELSHMPTEERKRIGLALAPIKDDVMDTTLQKTYVCTLSTVDAFHACEDIKTLMKDVAEFDTAIDVEPLELFLSQAEDFLSLVKSHQGRSKLTDQMILDIATERRRLVILQNYYRVKYTQDMSTSNDVQGMDKDVDILEMTLANISGPSDAEYQSKLEMLQSIIETPWKCIPLVNEEREMIISATGAKPGSWYKCPQGHYYNVNECGGPTQIGTCPECN